MNWILIWQVYCKSAAEYFFFTRVLYYLGHLSKRDRCFSITIWSVFTQVRNVNQSCTCPLLEVDLVLGITRAIHKYDGKVTTSTGDPLHDVGSTSHNHHSLGLPAHTAREGTLRQNECPDILARAKMTSLMWRFRNLFQKLKKWGIFEKKTVF